MALPSDPVLAVELLLEGAGGGWSADDLRRLRRVLADEYVGEGRAEALAAVDRLLADQ